MNYYKEQFNKAGWFVPPYVQMGYLNEIAGDISKNNDSNLESLLSRIYTHDHLAAMVVHRYPIVPHISDYKLIIAEAIDAHFLGLHHVAVSGLIPVIEGAGRKILESKNISENYVKNVFVALAEHCKEDVISNNLGAVDEIVAMLDSFVHFTNNNLYVKSTRYPHGDKTNRHGILHGAFSDSDYGTPINFYKAIGSIEFLCFVVSIREPISFFAPNSSEVSFKLAKQYALFQKMNDWRKYG
ncbi:hypothetical protein [Vibrio parahaemolyticus]|uniref:hypothetical protein n=1 Tax=Vibrio parahaemolyticus TaxID=670 RepID=UPI0006A6B14D|nr:hypothetical protein [Vibrio parahaemolyticus]EGR0214173.1 hypothetical protein [Vibrio parahaemolyticus]EJG2023480.1 hypothetical protein [Vibrio parahaemolyticus]EJG2035326.1 hypothetical protein [Vibrio parahaemolyticus]ELB2780057.1 hypothetical protein [Vibrio parahaemolyticus]KON61255.1 hypothetical protein ACX11_07105 [Vibrio parahaemolyticus]